MRPFPTRRGCPVSDTYEPTLLALGLNFNAKQTGSNGTNLTFLTEIDIDTAPSGPNMVMTTGSSAS